MIRRAWVAAIALLVLGCSGASNPSASPVDTRRQTAPPVATTSPTPTATATPAATEPPRADWAHLNIRGQAAEAALIWPVVRETLGW